MAKNIFFVGDPARADKVATHFDTIEHREQNREFITRTGKYKGMPVTVLATGIGTDNCEVALVELFGLNEFDLKTKIRCEPSTPLTIIRIGTCGGVQEEIDPGTLAITEYALGLDNTGLYYDQPAPDETSLKIEKKAYEIITEATPDNRRFKGKICPYVSKASPEIIDALKKHADRYVSGITAVASGFFAPQGRLITGLDLTVPNIQEHFAKLEINGRKIYNFEMESSLIYHLAAKMGYRAGTISPIIANRPRGTFLGDYSDAVERAIKAALEAMLELYNE